MHPPLRLSIFYVSRDQPRPGSFLKKREEPGNEVTIINELVVDEGKIGDENIAEEFNSFFKNYYN
jgi:hypothetical protein